MERTHLWAKRCVAYASEHFHSYQSLFPIVQGCIYEDLRRESARFIGGLDTRGVAIGGLSVGETTEQMYQVLDWIMPELPTHKPRYLM